MQLDKKDWQTVRFGDVVRQVTGSVDAEASGLEHYIAGEHMRSNDLHLRTWGTIGEGYLGPAFHRLFEVGDILYGSRRTYLKKVAVADFDGITANTTFVMKENLDLVVPGFVPFLMLSDRFTEHSVKNSKGSVNPYINFKDIAKFTFRLPPRAQQARLADLLWAADAVGEGYRIQLTALMSVKATMLEEVFAGSCHPLIPLGDVGKWLSGGTPNRAEESYWNGTIPWASPKDMKTDWLGTTQEFVTEAGAAAASRLIPTDTVLMVVRGMILAHTFPVALTTAPMTFNQDMKGLLTGEAFVPRFVFYFLKHQAESVLANTAESTHGTKRIPSEVLFELGIPDYPLDEQATFLARMQLLEDTVAKCESQIEVAHATKQALLNHIFSA